MPIVILRLMKCFWRIHPRTNALKGVILDTIGEIISIASYTARLVMKTNIRLCKRILTIISDVKTIVLASKELNMFMVNIVWSNAQQMLYFMRRKMTVVSFAWKIAHLRSHL